MLGFIYDENNIRDFIQNEFEEATIDKKIDFLTSIFNKNIKENNEFISYILKQNELLDKLALEVFDNPYKFENIGETLQNTIISKNIEKIKNLGEDTQISIWTNTKNSEIQDYLYESVRIVEKLAKKNHSNIFVNIEKVKNIETFKKIIDNNDIYEKIVNKYEFLNGIYIYNYSHFSSLSDNEQEYILNKLENDERNLDEAITEMLISSSENIFISHIKTIPDNQELLIKYCKITKDEEAKKKLVNSIGRIYMEEEIENIISLYPSILSDNELIEILNNASASIIIRYFKKSKTEMNDIVKNLVLNKYLEGKDFIEVYNYSFLKENIFTNEEQLLKVFDNTKPDSLFSISAKDSYAYDTLLKKLKSNPDYLKNIDIISVRGNFNKEQIEYLFNYLKPNIAFSLFDEKSFDFVMEKLNKNPEYAQYIQNIELKREILNNINNESEILHYISFDFISNFNDFEKKMDKVVEGLIQGKRQIIRFNDDTYNKLSETQKRTLINNLNNQDFILRIYVEEKNLTLKELMKEKIIMHQDEIFKNCRRDISEFVNLPQDELNEIYKMLNNNSILTLYSAKNNALLEKTIMDRFANDNNIFNHNQNAEEIIASLNIENRNILYNEMKQKLSIALKDDIELYNKLIKNDTILNFKFIEALEKGQFENKEIYDKFRSMLDNNQFLVSTLDFEMLDKDFININEHFIEKVSKYPELQSRLINMKNNSDNFNEFTQVLSQISNDETKIFDKKVLRILDVFESGEIKFDKNLSEKEIDNLIRYILINSEPFQFSENHMQLKNINPLDLDNEILKRCDERFQKATSITELKSVILEKYFDMTYSDAKEFLRMYDNNKNGVSIEPEAMDFMNCVKDIINMENPNMLKELYKTHKHRFTINDVLEVENSLQKSYTKELQENMFKGNGAEIKLEINGEQISVIEPNDNFKILTHSTNAYSTMPMIDDNYYKSWNMSSKTNNHGICTACVSDKCLGLPPLGKEGDGCIFGFTEFSENSVTNIAPYDLMSANGDYELITGRKLIYTSVEDMLNKTRHSHNECVLERKNLLNNDSVNIQPQYVIITSEMNDLQRENSLKASREMNPPEGLPIVYLDIEKIVMKNKENIENQIKEFIDTKDVKVFEKLLNDYESTRCTLRTINDYDFIKTEQIDNIISQYIDYCSSLDTEESKEKLSELASVLDAEKEKFDLVVDSGNRFKSIDIKYNEHMENIYSNKNNFTRDIDKDLEEYQKYHEMSEMVNHDNENVDINEQIARISLLSEKIGESLDVTEIEKQAMTIASIHLESDLEKSNIEINEEIKKLASVMIKYSKLDDNDVLLDNIMDKYNISLEYRDRLKQLSDGIKDATDLDKVRHENQKETLNPNKLRLEESKYLMTYAKELYESTNQELNKEAIIDESGIKR